MNLLILRYTFWCLNPKKEFDARPILKSKNIFFNCFKKSFQKLSFNLPELFSWKFTAFLTSSNLKSCMIMNKWRTNAISIVRLSHYLSFRNKRFCIRGIWSSFVFNASSSQLIFNYTKCWRWSSKVDVALLSHPKKILCDEWRAFLLKTCSYIYDL